MSKKTNVKPKCWKLDVAAVRAWNKRLSERGAKRYLRRSQALDTLGKLYWPNGMSKERYPRGKVPIPAHKVQERQLRTKLWRLSGLYGQLKNVQMNAGDYKRNYWSFAAGESFKFVVDSMLEEIEHLRRDIANLRRQES